MKIKTYKYIVFYIIILFLSFFVYKNFSILKDYVKYKEFYEFVDSYKTRKSISYPDTGNILKIKKNQLSGNLSYFFYLGLYSNIFNIDSLLNKQAYLGKIKKKIESRYHHKLSSSGFKFPINKLLGLDKSNLYLLDQDFNNAKKSILEEKEYNYKHYYNLANINLLEAKYKFENNLTGYIKSTQKSINYYETALKLVPSYKKKDFILNNLNIARKYLDYLYFYNCNSIFIKLLKYAQSIKSKLEKINTILNAQLYALEKRKKYPELRKCILQIEKDTKKNKVLINQNNMFFELIYKGIILRWKNYVKDNYDVCYQDRFLLKDKFLKSLIGLDIYFSDFLYNQSMILNTLLFGTKKNIEDLCSGRKDMAGKQKKKNKKAMNDYKSLKDLLPPLNKNPNKDGENGKKKLKDGSDKMFRDLKIDDFEKIYEKGAKTFKRLQKEKTKNNYNPDKYIKDIFKKFYGNEEDFIKNKKKNSVGK